MIKKRRLAIDQDAAIVPEIYHVTQRAPGREMMFIEEEDYLLFLKLLKKTTQKVPLEIYAFALMPNHVHLLAKAVPRDLAAAMKTLFQSYAQIFNAKYKRKGHVVCGTYHARYCGDAGYLLNVSLYIHLNPFKARLADDVYAYRWTSLSCYVNSRIKSFVNPQLVLSLFENSARPHHSYRELINEIKEIRYRNVLADRTALSRFHHELFKWFDELRGKYGFSSALIKLIDENQKWSGIMQRHGSKTRDKKAVHYYVQQMKSQGYTYQEIAQELKITRMHLYRLLKE